MRKLSDILVDPHNTPETILKAAEQSLILGYKEYTIPQYQIGDKIEPLNVHIKHPDQDVDLLVAEAYTQKYNELLKNDNYMTWDEMKINLNKRGIWTDNDEKKYINSDTILRDAALKLGIWSIKNNLDKKGRSKSEEKTFQERKQEYDRIDNEIMNLNLKRYGFYRNSIEGQSTEYANYYKFVYCILVEKDGKWIRLWNSLEDFRNETSFNRNKITELSTMAYAFWAGISTEVLNDLPNRDMVGEGIQNDSEES